MKQTRFSRAAALLAALCLLLSLAGCGSEAAPAADEPAVTAAETAAEPAAAPADTAAENPEDPETYTCRTVFSAAPDSLDPVLAGNEAAAFLTGQLTAPLWLTETAADGSSVLYSVAAACEPEDVTAQYAGSSLYGLSEDAADGYAWRITLNEALCWEDGTPVTSADYLRTLERALDPDIQSPLAAQFTSGALALANARAWQIGVQADTVYADYASLTGSALADADYRLAAGIQQLYFNPDACNSWLGTSFADYMAGTDRLDTVRSLCEADTYSPLTDELREQLEALLCSWYGEDGASYLPWLCFFPLSSGESGYVSLQEAGYSSVEEFLADGGTLAGLYVDTRICSDADSSADESDVPQYLSAADETEWVLPLSQYSDEDAEETAPDDEAASVISGAVLYEMLGTMEEADAVEYLYVQCSAEAPAWDAVGFIQEDDTHFTLIFAQPVAEAELVGSLQLPQSSADDSQAMSCGPYLLVSLDESSAVLTRSKSWFSFAADYSGPLSGLWQTDSIEIDFTAESSVAEGLFLQGSLDLWTAEADELGSLAGSDCLVYTPAAAVEVLIFNCDEDALLTEDGGGENHSILSLETFRKAVSLSLDRSAYTASVNPGSTAADTLLSSGCSDAGSALSAPAVPEGDASALLEEAYTEARAAHLISGGDTVVINLHLSAGDDFSIALVQWLQDCLDSAAAGTSLEGRIEIRSVRDNDRLESARAGGCDLIFASCSASSGEALDLLQIFLSDQYRLSYGYSPAEIPLTLTIDEGAQTRTLTEWFEALTEGDLCAAGPEVRTALISALEQQLLEDAAVVPVGFPSAITAVSSRISHYSEELAFLTFSMNDAEWLRSCAELNYELPYISEPAEAE